MTLQEQLIQHRTELINNQAQQFDLSERRKELLVIVQALEMGAKREEELLTKQSSN